MDETRCLWKNLYGCFACKTRGCDPALRIGRTSLAAPGLIFEVAKNGR
jgi:hypothetical protein